MHFHLFDLQLINRVGWDGAVRLPDANELGWKDTVRVSPLEDTIVALRPTSMALPFKIPDSVRPLDPTMPVGSTTGFSSVDPLTGDVLPTPVTNQLTNFGWEYVWHCHILSHEEMDMMRPISFRVSPAAPSALTRIAPPSNTNPPSVAIKWNSNFTTPIATNMYIERSTTADFTAAVATFSVGATAASFVDTSLTSSTYSYYYRVRSENANSYSVWSNTVKVTSTKSLSIAAAPKTVTRPATGRLSRCAQLVGRRSRHDQGVREDAWSDQVGAP